MTVKRARSLSGDDNAEDSNASGASSEEGSDSDACADGDECAMWCQMCYHTVDEFLAKVKGMSKEDAKAFRKQHLTVTAENVTYEDSDEVRSVQSSFKYTNTITMDGEEQAVSLSGTFDYHHRVRSFIEHRAIAKFSAETASKAVSGGVMKSTEYSRRAPRGVDIPFIESRKFQLKKTHVAAIQSVFGEGWSKHEAVLFMYAALGLDYGDSVFRIDSLAKAPVLKSGWLEHYTRAVCEVEKASGKGKKKAAKGKGVAQENAKGAKKQKVEDDGWVTDNPADEFEQHIAEHQEFNAYEEGGYSDEDMRGGGLYGKCGGTWGEGLFEGLW